MLIPTLILNTFIRNTHIDTNINVDIRSHANVDINRNTCMNVSTTSHSSSSSSKNTSIIVHTDTNMHSNNNKTTDKTTSQMIMPTRVLTLILIMTMFNLGTNVGVCFVWGTALMRIFLKLCSTPNVSDTTLMRSFGGLSGGLMFFAFPPC